jgi:hypothetical protein
MAALSREQLCNLGLVKIRAKPLASFEENSLEGRECRRFYPILLDIMLSGMEFSFATQRLALTLITNDRSGEWLYAYNLPPNMGSALRLLPDFAGLGLGVPVALPGEPYAEAWSTNTDLYAAPYIIEGQTLYSNIEDATLEYSIGDVAGLQLTPLVQVAIGTQLAAWLAMPVKGNGAMEAKYSGDAEVAWQRALADDRQRQPQQDGQFISEREAARAYGVT